MKIISSKSNSFYRELSRLISKGGADRRCFVLEGVRYIQTALEESIVPESIIYSSSCSIEPLILPSKARVSTYQIKASLFDAIVPTKQSQGVLAIYRRPETKFNGGICIVLDEVQDPGNVGTIIRTADAAGITDIITIRGSADPFSQKAARASAGSILNVGVAQMRRSEAIDFLINEDYYVVCADLRDAQDYVDAIRGFISQKIAKIALILGNEAAGIDKEFLRIADSVVKIPIIGRAESLNVATAAGIIIYELIKESRKK